MTRVTRRRTPRKGAPKTQQGSARKPPAPPPASRVERKLETRRRLAEAAFELFSTRGYDETSTKDIAAQAGVASGTVFVHASDKADLLFLVMHDRLASTSDRAFATLPKGPLLEQLLHVFGLLYRMYAGLPGIASAFVRALPGATGPNGQQVNALTFAFLHRLATLVREAQARREIVRDVDPAALAQNLFGLYFMGLWAWLSGLVPIEAAVDPYLKGALELQLRGLRVGAHPPTLR